MHELRAGVGTEARKRELSARITSKREPARLRCYGHKTWSHCIYLRIYDTWWSWRFWNGKELKLLFPSPDKIKRDRRDIWHSVVFFWETRPGTCRRLGFPRTQSLVRRGRLYAPMSYQQFANDSKRGSSPSIEFAEDEKTAPFPSEIPLVQMAESNFDGGPSLSNSGSSKT